MPEISVNLNFRPISKTEAAAVAQPILQRIEGDFLKVFMPDPVACEVLSVDLKSNDRR